MLLVKLGSVFMNSKNIILILMFSLVLVSNTIHATTALYDEQSGLSYTGSFTAMVFNVTAVAQSAPSGTGPAYFVNGYSNEGYWYQIGLSYDWVTNYSSSHYIGFRANYEVFSPNGTSIYPLNGWGGIANLNVNPGDTVQLSLVINATTNEVKMKAYDYNTGSYFVTNYSAFGATEFVGTPNSPSVNGFFTGLMTEWYNVYATFGNQLEVVYSEVGAVQQSAWLWVDEFYCSDGSHCYNKTNIFYNSTPAPVSSTRIFSTHDFAEEYYNNGEDFVTGLTPPSPFDLVSTNIKELETDEGVVLHYPITISVTGGTPPYIYTINFNGRPYETYVSNFTSVTMNFTLETSCGKSFYNGSIICSVNPGTYYYNATVTDNNGYVVSSTNGQIQLNNPPQISLNAKQTTIDAGKQLTVNYNITGGTPPFNVSYFLNGENVGTSLNISKPGTYYLYAQLRDGAGFITNSSQISITVNPPPQINLHLNKTTIDFGQALKPYYNITGGTEPFNVSYFLNGENIGSTLTIPSAGNYSLYARVIDRYGLVANSPSIIFKVNPKPTISIKYNRTITDVDTPIKLVAIGNYGTLPYSYKWYVNNQVVASSNTTYSLLENKSGNYVVFASITDSVGGTNNSSKVTFIVNKLPNASRLNVQPSSSVLFINNSANVAVSISGGSPPYSYKWYVNGILQNNSNSSYCTLRDLKNGNNNITVEVIDAYGNKAYSSYVIATSINYALIIAVVVVGLIIVGGVVYFLITKKRKEDSVTNYVSDSNKMKEDEAKEDDAIRQLNLRYAKGEITKEQYTEMKKDLKE